MAPASHIPISDPGAIISGMSYAGEPAIDDFKLDLDGEAMTAMRVHLAPPRSVTMQDDLHRAALELDTLRLNLDGLWPTDDD